MLHIDCPYCGMRAETEFKYGGEAHISRPKSPKHVSDTTWANFLFMATNTKGLFRERWMHTAGCRKWFNMVRDTTTHEIIGTYKTGERPSLKALREKGDAS